MEEDEILVESWLILKEYIKDKQQAADHWIGALIDTGLPEETINALAGADKYLKQAVEYSGGLEEEDSYEDDDGW
jgi:hypothetical protein|tara:strand:- start:3326 stop:3550 length:225 start_codon:yes stop_codon:yes gene_type:complete